MGRHHVSGVVMPTIIMLLPLGLLLAGGVGAADMQIPTMAGRYHSTLVKIAQREFGLSAQVARFGAQVHTESGWVIGARSPAGAEGLAQFMPSTAAWLSSTDHSLFPTDLHSPTWSLQALVRYMRILLAEVHGPDECSLWWAALRAYNGGIGHWQREAKVANGQDRVAVDATCGSASRARIHCRENLEYPAKIMFKFEPVYIKAGWAGALACKGAS